MVRQPIVAGQFYENNSSELDKQIANCFKSDFGPASLPKQKRKNRLIGIISPHAGYPFSGPCQAWSYKEIAESEFPDTYILLGLSHGGYESCLSIKNWKTPFGIVKNDKEFIRTQHRSTAPFSSIHK
jgi:MEMO1 family protein